MSEIIRAGGLSVIADESITPEQTSFRLRLLISAPSFGVLETDYSSLNVPVQSGGVWSIQDNLGVRPLPDGATVAVYSNIAGAGPAQLYWLDGDQASLYGESALSEKKVIRVVHAPREMGEQGASYIYAAPDSYGSPSWRETTSLDTLFAALGDIERAEALKLATRVGALEQVSYVIGCNDLFLVRVATGTMVDASVITPESLVLVRQDGPEPGFLQLAVVVGSTSGKAHCFMRYGAESTTWNLSESLLYGDLLSAGVAEVKYMLTRDGEDTLKPVTDLESDRRRLMLSLLQLPHT